MMPKILDGYPRENSADPDQTALLFANFVFKKHFFVAKFLCSNFRVITAYFYGVRKCRKIAALYILDSLLLKAQCGDRI